LLTQTKYLRYCLFLLALETLFLLLNGVETTQVEAALVALDTLTDVLCIAIRIPGRNTYTVTSNTVTTRLHFETRLDNAVRQIKTFFSFSGSYGRHVVIIERKEGFVFSAIFPTCNLGDRVDLGLNGG
jgi:hypothetical protein